MLQGKVTRPGLKLEKSSKSINEQQSSINQLVKRRDPTRCRDWPSINKGPRRAVLLGGGVPSILTNELREYGYSPPQSGLPPRASLLFIRIRIEECSVSVRLYRCMYVCMYVCTMYLSQRTSRGSLSFQAPSLVCKTFNLCHGFPSLHLHQYTTKKQQQAVPPT